MIPELTLFVFCSMAKVYGQAPNREPAPDGPREALDLADTERDAVARAIIRAQVYFQAGDYPAVVQAAEMGLSHSPEDLTLLWRVVAAQLWLQEGDQAAAYVVRLQKSIYSSYLDDHEREQWLNAVAIMEKSAVELTLSTKAGSRALWGARLVVAVSGSGLLVGVFCLVKS